MSAATADHDVRAPVAEAEPADDTARLTLAFNAYEQLAELARGMRKLLIEDSKISSPGTNPHVYIGMVSRIELLGDIIFHAARLDGCGDQEWAHWDDIIALQRAFDGGLS